METEEIRSVLIKTTGISLHHYFLGLIAGPWFPILEIMAYLHITTIKALLPSHRLKSLEKFLNFQPSNI